MAFDAIVVTLSCLLIGGRLAVLFRRPGTQIVRVAVICAGSFWAFVLLLSGSLVGLLLAGAVVLIAAPWRSVRHRDAT